MLFLIPVGGGIPAGILLAQKNGLSWPVSSSLYFLSDVVLAFSFEPILRALVWLGNRVPAIAHAAAVVRMAMERTAQQYAGLSPGPFMLVMIAFGVDPMTGRAAAMAAGHGFITGWAIAIAGDMLYFWVVALATVKLNGVLKSPDAAVATVLLLMFLVPVLVRKAKAALAR